MESAPDDTGGVVAEVMHGLAQDQQRLLDDVDRLLHLERRRRVMAETVAGNVAWAERQHHHGVGSELEPGLPCLQAKPRAAGTHGPAPSRRLAMRWSTRLSMPWPRPGNRSQVTCAPSICKRAAASTANVAGI